LLATLGAISIVFGAHFATNTPVAEAATITWSGTVNLGSAGYTVPAGTTVTFDPNVDTTVRSSGNIIVRGTLIMKPANGSIDHLLQFDGINENNFVGGGMDPIASDVGLWVMGAGKIILQGESKPAWAYTWQSSWETTDEVKAAPNTPGNYGNFVEVNGTPAKNALGYSAELLNLTRNVRVQGTTAGYSHVFIRSSVPSTIKNAAFRYMAPDFGSSDITGRYGLHIHMAGNGSRGTVIDGLVVRDTKGHAFVPHMSNGITFKNTIAYNVMGEAYWWDEGTSSDDISFDKAVVAIMRASNNPSNTHRLGAFYLGSGDNVSVTNSVVVGLQREDGASRSGYIWPEDDEATWTFKNNRAHNNQTNGIFVWQNNEMPHVIDGFVAYYNSQSGVEHGAYTNSYVYKNLTLLGNGTAIHSHAMGEPGDAGADTQIWSKIKTNGGTLYIDEHARDAERPVRFVDCDLGRVDVNDSGGAEHSEYDFIRCGLEPSDFDLSSARPDSVFRVQRSNGTAYRLMGNGAVTSINPFYNGSVPGTGFSDTNGHVFEAAIDWLAAKGITNGCNPPSNSRFCPNDYVTRGQMAAFLVRALGYSSAGSGNYFNDTNGHIFEAAIDKLRTAGVTQGCNSSGTRFCPDRRVTRGEMAAFLVRAFGYSAGGNTNYFVDDNGHVFESVINRLRAAGVTLGCNPPSNNRFCPDNYVTRGQMAAFLKRAIDSAASAASDSSAIVARSANSGLAVAFSGERAVQPTDAPMPIWCALVT
jgi:hypothetical protein